MMKYKTKQKNLIKLPIPDYWYRVNLLVIWLYANISSKKWQKYSGLSLQQQCVYDKDNMQKSKDFITWDF